MPLSLPRTVRPSPAAQEAADALDAAGWAIADDGPIELGWAPPAGADAPRIVLAPTRELARAAVEGGAVDAIVWPDERDRLPQALAVALRFAEHLALHAAYVRAFRGNADWMEITHPSGVLIDVSEGFVRHSGFTRAEALGRTPAQLFRAGTHSRAFYTGIQDTVSRGEDWAGDLVARRKDGSWAVLDARIGPVAYAGLVVAHFASKRVPQASASSSLRTRMDAATTAPWVLAAPGGTIVDHGPGAPEVLGHADLVGALAESLGLVGPGDVWLRGARGLRAWEVREEPLVAGDLELVLYVLHDVNQRKRHEEELDALAQHLALARDQALAADQAKTAFLMSMSHELRTPLNAILGYTELLLEGPCPPESRVDLNRILSAGRHLLHLVDEVLDLARVESGKVTVTEGPVDLPALFAEAVEAVRLRAAARGQRLVVQGAAGRIRSDRRLLHQILLNLLGNAAKYAVPGVITVGLEWEDGPTLFVEDEGPGLDEAALLRVFQPFVQLQPGAAGGVGLGLAISRRLARSLGGDLVARSSPGRGTRFSLRLPARCRA